MNAALIIITFISGTSWGPLVSSVPMQSLNACNSARVTVAAQIMKTAQSNMTSEISIKEEGIHSSVTSHPGKVLASLTCVSSVK